jgi:hypothetical protein
MKTYLAAVTWLTIGMLLVSAADDFSTRCHGKHLAEPGVFLLLATWPLFIPIGIVIGIALGGEDGFVCETGYK